MCCTRRIPHTKRAVISARRVGSSYEHVQSCCWNGKGVGCDEIWIKDVTLAVRIGRQQQQLHRRSQHQHPLLHQRPNLQLHQRKHGSLVVRFSDAFPWGTSKVLIQCVLEVYHLRCSQSQRWGIGVEIVSFHQSARYKRVQVKTQNIKFCGIWYALFFSACWAQRSICRMVGCTYCTKNLCERVTIRSFVDLLHFPGLGMWVEKLEEHTKPSQSTEPRVREEERFEIEQDFFQVNVSFRFRMRWKTL